MPQPFDPPLDVRGFLSEITSFPDPDPNGIGAKINQYRLTFTANIGELGVSSVQPFEITITEIPARVQHDGHMPFDFDSPGCSGPFRLTIVPIFG